MTTKNPPFRLDLRSTRGPRLARVREDDDDIAVHEWTTWLRIRSDVIGFVGSGANLDDDDYTGFVPPAFEDDALAVLVVARPQQDFEGRSIGVFHGRLDHDEFGRLSKTVEDIRWADLPRPSGGDFSAPTLEICYERGNVLIQRSFNAQNGNVLEAIAPLMRQFDEVLTRARKGPSATLEVAVAVDLDEHDPMRRVLKVTLRNRGVSGVVITDPRVPPTANRPTRLVIRVGELVSPHAGVDPSEWTTLPLPPLPERAPRSLTLGPHRQIEFALAWQAPKPGRYLVRVEWQDYEGPVETVPGQTPFMPLPKRGPSYLGSGPYPLRGANFMSRQFEVSVSEPP